MTFSEIMGPRVTPEEWDACAWHLAMFRAPQNLGSPAMEERRCFTYCGDDACTCEARDVGIIPASGWKPMTVQSRATTERSDRARDAPTDTDPVGGDTVEGVKP